MQPQSKRPGLGFIDFTPLLQLLKEHKIPYPKFFYEEHKDFYHYSIKKGFRQFTGITLLRICARLYHEYGIKANIADICRYSFYKPELPPAKKIPPRKTWLIDCAEVLKRIDGVRQKDFFNVALYYRLKNNSELFIRGRLLDELCKAINCKREDILRKED